MVCQITTEPTILLFYLNPLDWASIAAPPYGLEILATSVKDLRVKVVIYNPFLYRDPELESQRLIKSLDPAMVGLSLRNLDNLAHVWDTKSEFSNGIQSRGFLPEIEQLIAIIHQSTTAPIVIGGSGFSISPVRLLQKFGLWIGVAGSGEIAFRELVQAVLRKEKMEEFACREAKRLPGIVVLKNSGIVVSSPSSGPRAGKDVSIIERLPEYNPSWTGTVPVRVSDGCSGRCSFCVEAGRLGYPIWRAAEHIIDEIRRVVSCNVKSIWLACSELNLPNENHAINLCRQISTSGMSELALSSYFLPRPFSRDLYYTLRDAGFTDHSICFGIVHPSDSVLERNNVGFCRLDIDNLINTMISAGAEGVVVGLILGLPGETEETLIEAVEWVREVDTIFGKNFRCFYNCGGRVYPGTELARFIKSKKNDDMLYGIDDPDYLMPVVYCATWPPRRIEEFFRSECSPCKGLISSYNKGSPMFHERPEVVINWQRAHAFSCVSNFEQAVIEFYMALSLARSPIVREQIIKALVPSLVRLGRIKEMGKLLRSIKADVFRKATFGNVIDRFEKERTNHEII